jgi:hypothetical protein
MLPPGVAAHAGWVARPAAPSRNLVCIATVQPSDIACPAPPLSATTCARADPCDNDTMGTEMNDDLQGTITELVESGSRSNPALSSLLSDYAKFHLVLAVVGGLFLVGVVVLGILCFGRFKRTARTGERKWSFESKTYFVFGALSVVLALGLALIVAANASNGLDPEAGFSGSLGLLGTPPSKLERAFDSWLQSGSTQVPPLVQNKVDARLAWQRPKAVVCSVLLVVCVMLAAHMWRTLIRRSRVREGRRRVGEALLLMAGVLAVPVCLLLMVMVMGNTQASLAPMSMTLFYG